MCGVMAVAPNTGPHALLSQHADLGIVRQRAFALENTYTSVHREEECDGNGPPCFHQGKTVTMTVDLRDSAIALPRAVLDQQSGGSSEPAASWMSQVLDSPTAQEEKQAEAKKAQIRERPWIGALRVECGLLELDGSFVSSCKLPAAPRDTRCEATTACLNASPFADAALAAGMRRSSCCRRARQCSL